LLNNGNVKLLKVDDNGNIIDYTIKKTIINVNKNLSYEVAQRRLSKNKILNHLAQLILKKDLPDGGNVSVGLKGDEFTFSIKKGRSATKNFKANEIMETV
jgi:hypothetical protein